MTPEKTIEFTCKQCGEKHAVSLSLARRKVNCSNCGWSNKVPLPKIRVSGSASAASSEFATDGTGTDEGEPVNSKKITRTIKRDEAGRKVSTKSNVHSINARTRFASKESTSIKPEVETLTTKPVGVSVRPSGYQGVASKKEGVPEFGRAASTKLEQPNVSLPEHGSTKYIAAGGKKDQSLLRTLAYFIVAFIIGFALFIPIYESFTTKLDQKRATNNNSPTENVIDENSDDNEPDIVVVPKPPPEEVSTTTPAAKNPKPKISQPSAQTVQPTPQLQSGGSNSGTSQSGSPTRSAPTKKPKLNSGFKDQKAPPNKTEQSADKNLDILDKFLQSNGD